MSGDPLHGGVHGWASSKCPQGVDGEMFLSSIAFGVSTSAGGQTLLTSVVLNSSQGSGGWATAGILHLSDTCIDGLSGSAKHLWWDEVSSENVSALFFLTEANCAFGRHCAAETVLLFRQVSCLWFPTWVLSIAFFVEIPFGCWVWSFGPVLNNNWGNLQTLFFLDSWLQLSKMLVADWHFLLPRLTGGAVATEMSNCGLTWNIKGKVNKIIHVVTYENYYVKFQHMKIKFMCRINF